MDIFLTALATFVAAAVGTALGSYVTYRVTTKAEREKKEHESKVAEVQLWATLRNQSIRIREESVKAVRARKSTSSGAEHDQFVTEIMVRRVALADRLAAARYEAHYKESEHYLNILTKKFNDNIKEFRYKKFPHRNGESERAKFLDRIFKELQEDLTIGHKFSWEMLKERKSEVLPLEEEHRSTSGDVSCSSTLSPSGFYTTGNFSCSPIGGSTGDSPQSG